MLVIYVRCIRYAIKKSFNLDYSDSDVMSGNVERLKKCYTPFALSDRKLPLRTHMFCSFGSFLYFRFWNKNHYDYYFMDLHVKPLKHGFNFFDFNSEVF